MAANASHAVIARPITNKVDIRNYARKGQNIVRDSCVGCGICSAVYPRGVLKIKNGSQEHRYDLPPIIIGNESIKIAD
jgi:ferredoxin-type protein NapH